MRGVRRWNAGFADLIGSAEYAATLEDGPDFVSDTASRSRHSLIRAIREIRVRVNDGGYRVRSIGFPASGTAAA
jgi:hypothetical protein